MLRKNPPYISDHVTKYFNTDPRNMLMIISTKIYENKTKTDTNEVSQKLMFQCDERLEINLQSQEFSHALPVIRIRTISLGEHYYGGSRGHD